VVETQTREAGFQISTPQSLIRYQFNNHLGSASLELDDSGAAISYEEYYPYGSTSYQAGRNAAEVSLKRYRYTGKEREEETGFYYHGARYYAPWLGRWTSADPIGVSGGMNLYDYAAANPIRLIDSTGHEPKTTYLGSSKEESYVSRLEKAWGGNQYWSNTGPSGAGWYVQTEGNQVSPHSSSAKRSAAVRASMERGGPDLLSGLQAIAPGATTKEGIEAIDAATRPIRISAKRSAAVRASMERGGPDLLSGLQAIQPGATTKEGIDSNKEEAAPEPDRTGAVLGGIGKGADVANVVLGAVGIPADTARIGRVGFLVLETGSRTRELGKVGWLANLSTLAVPVGPKMAIAPSATGAKILGVAGTAVNGIGVGVGVANAVSGYKKGDTSQVVQGTADAVASVIGFLGPHGRSFSVGYSLTNLVIAAVPTSHESRFEKVEVYTHHERLVVGHYISD